MTLEQLRRAGRTTAELIGPQGRIRAELHIDGLSTRLTAFTTYDEHFELRDRQDLVCRLPSGTHFSLLDALKLEETMPGRQGDHDGQIAYFPHWLILGEGPFDRQAGVSQIAFTVRDAALIFSDWRHFRRERVSAKALSSILPATDTVAGDELRLMVLPDDGDLVDVATALGRLKVQRVLLPNNERDRQHGYRVAIFLSLNFETPQRLEEAVRRAHAVRRFLEIIAGRAQRMKKLSVRSAAATSERLRHFQVYSPGDGVQGLDDRSQRHITSLPMTHVLQPEAFGSVLAAWLASDEARLAARARFQGGFLQGESFNVDRLVSGANMFDLLPPGDAPPPETPDAEIALARDLARKAFKALPQSPERDSVLNALGRIGRPSLKRRVLHRAAPLIARAGSRLGRLDFVLQEAVDARNFYVHGSLPARRSAALYGGQMHFLTEALEFTFACSELLEAGWNFTDYLNRAAAADHVFTRFVKTYHLMLADYDAALDASCVGLRPSPAP